MKLAEVLALTNTNKRTIYRWMDRHPTIDVEDNKSLLGHAFPKPVRKEGREVIWDDSAVEAWWAANATTLGRHPKDAPTFTMSWQRFREAMIVKPKVHRDEEAGTDEIIDDIKMVQRFEQQGEQVRLWFRDVGDAVYFKLKYM